MKAAPRILIADDDEEFVTLLGRVLRRGGYVVISAADGCDVPEMLENNRIDLLMLDLNMPGMNGWEVMRYLRDPLSGSIMKCHPKVAVVSARDEEDTENFARRLGADGYIRKPLWGNQLLKQVRRILEA